MFTNKTFTDAYRGAGRPEATYAIERAMDTLARELEMDPVELRRKNFIPTDKFPNHTIASGLTVDSADYEGTLDALPRGARLRRDPAPSRPSGASAATGSCSAIGFSTWIEMCGLAPSRVLSALNYVAGGWDSATIELHADRNGSRRHRRLPHGQGSATVFAQVVADQLGVEYDDVEVLQGDTASRRSGWTPTAAAALAVGGVALH